MDHYRLAGLGGDFELLAEYRLLHVARGEIVVIIEADLADG
jgi:hypothetical protein